MNLVIGMPIIKACVYIVMVHATRRTITMLPKKRWNFHPNLIGSMFALHVDVMIDIGIIAQMPSPPIILTEFLDLLISLIGVIMMRRRSNIPDSVVSKNYPKPFWIGWMQWGRM